MTIQFEVGRTYYARSTCDYECIFRFTILARTAKTITTKAHGKIVRRGLSVYDGVEQFKPFGTHSMRAVVSAGNYPADVPRIGCDMTDDRPALKPEDIIITPEMIDAGVYEYASRFLEISNACEEDPLREAISAIFSSMLCIQIKQIS